MLTYPIELDTDHNGDFIVESPDFDELSTFGVNRTDALERAADALEEAIAARIARREDIPAASPGGPRVALPILTSLKVMLYQGMRERDVRKGELARRLGWYLPQVDRVLDLYHSSRLEKMEEAFAAIGLRLDIAIRDAHDVAAFSVTEERVSQNLRGRRTGYRR